MLFCKLSSFYPQCLCHILAILFRHINKAILPMGHATVARTLALKSYTFRPPLLIRHKILSVTEKTVYTDTMTKLLFLICLSKLIAAEINLKDAASFLILSSPNPEFEQVLSITPIANHHLNVKSPNTCGKGELLSNSEQQIECKMKLAGQNELNIYVCDDANTFCRREVLTVNVSYPNTITGWVHYLQNLF